jgi:DNA mismatch repair protein MutS2
MPISLQTVETLEFPKIREQLARHVAFSASRDLALELIPTTDPFVVRRALQATSQARRLLDDHPDISIGGARDIRPAAGLARRGGMLEGSALLEVAATLASARRLRAQILKLDNTTYGLLCELAGGLPSLPAIEDAIIRAVGDDGNLLDSASPALGRLRAEIRIAYGRLQDRLQTMINSNTGSESLQEQIITIRNGRYVVPVKASHRRNIRGLVHDQSASGATLYIEPLAIVELNNKWRELQLAEQEEVNRILAELSGMVGSEAPAIIAGVEALAELDLAFAKAKYSLALRCIEPEIVEPGVAGDLLSLREARHPLLDQKKVVPTTMRLGGDFHMLLITGPNTGGKTVALKTTGLLAMMAQAGLHIPASEPSRLPIFGKIFADIGDEQSIEQSLSTFSSHMTNIIRILRALDGGDGQQPSANAGAAPSAAELERMSNWRKVDPGEWAPLEPVFEQPLPVLVLLDELGAGTDPVEGAALARAIIERLLERGVLGIATTHYAELKAYAYATPGVVNGSVEFDVETLAPTYKLTIGLPGRSNALAIATRLGLDTQIVERARSTMAHEDAHVEDLLAGIHREREAAEAELKRAEELRQDAEKYRERLAEELRTFDERREDEWKAAREELEREIREARSQLRRLRDEFRSVTISRQWLEEAEKRLQEAKEQIPTSIPGKPRPIPAAPTLAVPQGPRPLQVGDSVLVRSVGLVGEILSIDEDEKAADVQVGGFRMRAEIGELQRQKGGKNANTRITETRSSLPTIPDISIDFDMRGWRVADVPDKLERYLSDAYLAGLPLVRIIHGKGTGALRQVVREALKGNKLVVSFNDASPAEGGAGVTVVRIQQQ